MAYNFSNCSYTDPSADNSTSFVINWTALATFNIFRTIAGFFTNSLTLYAFLTSASLQGAFSIYLVTLLLVNLFGTVIMGPLDIYANFNPAWMLGSHVCTLYLYCQWTVMGIMFHIHLVITFNRMWAVFWPISYRQKHNRRVAALICVGAILYSNMATLPFLITDELFYRLPEEQNGCVQNVQKQHDYAISLMLGFLDLPMAVILIGCPVVLMKKYMLDRKKNHVKVQPLESAVTTMNTDLDEKSNEVAVSKPKNRPGSHGSLITALLTLSVIVCWVPNIIYYTMVSFSSTYYVPAIAIVTDNCIILQSVFDPILFGIALKDVRVAVKNLLFNRF